jgi:hypothetical protein
MIKEGVIRWYFYNFNIHFLNRYNFGLNWVLAGLIGLRPGTGGTEVRLPISSGFFTCANFYVKDALGCDLLTGYRVMDDRLRL